MARLRPFRAWRYASDSTDISSIIAPPYDVISPEQRATLISGDARNVVALELPDGPLDPDAPGNRYETGAATWAAWRADGTLTRDGRDAIYVLEQRFDVGGCPIRRRALIAEVGLEPFDAGVILPHERTLPKALGDRLRLLRTTAANFSQVFGLFDDPDLASDEFFDAAARTTPVATATDADGVASTLWAITDEATVERIKTLLADARIFIADGHHRYTTALAYRDEQRAAAPAGAPADPDYDFVMMALVNMDDPDLVVLPTHRVADAPGGFDADTFWQALGDYFDIAELPPGHPAGTLEDRDRPTYLVKTRADARPRLVTLRDDVDLDTAIPLDRSEGWKELDVAVLQELILNPLLGIHPDRPETLERLAFPKDAHEALSMTAEHDVAFVVRPTRMDQLRAVAVAGETMPQKSTYFYPKLPSGLVLRSID